MPYQLKRFRRSVQRELRNLPSRIQSDVIQIILELQNDPYPLYSESLRDQYADIYKIKVDGWRIFYRVIEEDKSIDIVNVKRRNPDTYTYLYSILF